MELVQKLRRAETWHSAERVAECTKRNESGSIPFSMVGSKKLFRVLHGCAMDEIVTLMRTNFCLARDSVTDLAGFTERGLVREKGGRYRSAEWVSSSLIRSGQDFGTIQDWHG
jgi:hypothetical protein